MSPKQDRFQAPPFPSLAEVLNDAEFPMSRSELLVRYGHIKIQWANGRVATLVSVLKNVEQPAFKSISDVAMIIGEITKT